MSDREGQILRLIADGLTDAGIGDVLGTTENTVKTLVKRLYLRMGALNRANAVDLGWRQGFLPGPD